MAAWPEALDDVGIHADSVDIDVVSAAWLASIEPYLSRSLHGDSPLSALRAGFAAGVATERGTLTLPPRHPHAEGAGRSPESRSDSPPPRHAEDVE